MSKIDNKLSPGPWKWLAVGVHNKTAPYNYRNLYVENLPKYLDNASHYVLMGPEHDIETPYEGCVIEDGSASGEYGGIDPRSPNALLLASAPSLYKALLFIASNPDNFSYKTAAVEVARKAINWKEELKQRSEHESD